MKPINQNQVDSKLTVMATSFISQIVVISINMFVIREYVYGTYLLGFAMMSVLIACLANKNTQRYQTFYLIYQQITSTILLFEITTSGSDGSKIAFILLYSAASIANLSQVENHFLSSSLIFVSLAYPVLRAFLRTANKNDYLSFIFSSLQVLIALIIIIQHNEKIECEKQKLRQLYVQKRKKILVLKKLIQHKLPSFFWLMENSNQMSRNSFDGFAGDLFELNLKTKLRGLQNKSLFHNGLNCFNIFFKHETEKKFHSLFDFLKGLQESQIIEDELVDVLKLQDCNLKLKSGFQQEEVSILHSNHDVQVQIQQDSNYNENYQTNSINKHQIVAVLEPHNVAYNKAMEGNIQGFENLYKNLEEHSQTPRKCNLIVSVFRYGQRLSIFVSIEESKVKSMAQELENLNSQNKFKDDLLAQVSHDFKTPINGMLAFVENITDQFSTHPQLQQFESITYSLEILRKSIYLLLYMVNDIQDYATIQSGKFRVSPCKFSILDIANEVLELMKINAQQRKINLILNVNMKNLEMYSDPNRLKQILFNLVSNSLKFTLQGQIAISISSEQENIISVSVSDTGVGIPPEIKNKLFRLYSTFDQNGLNKQGVGLGLYIVKSMIDLLGPSQEVQLDSQEAFGTTVRFKIFRYMMDYVIQKKAYSHVLSQNQSSIRKRGHMSSIYILMNNERSQSKQEPNQTSLRQISYSEGVKNLTESDEAPSIHKNVSSHQMTINSKFIHRSPKIKSQIQKYNILVVDDEPFNVMALKLICKGLVKNLDEAYNGYEAVNKIKQNAVQKRYYDYIFLDLTMPILNGLETASAIYDLVTRSEIPQPVLIAITGYDGDTERENCMKYGFEAVLPKPITQAMIKEILQ